MALRVACVDWPARGSAPRTKNEAEANARLIAAAPDLLKALKDLVSEAVEVWEYPETYGTIADALAAIAKAEGR